MFSFLRNDFAVDLGTANTLIMHNGKVVVNEPSIIAIDRNNNKVVAVGQEAMNMHEKTHSNIKTIKPLKDGVIADFHAAEQLIKGMINKVMKKSFIRGGYRFVVCIPYAATEVEKRAVRDSAQHVGAKELYMIHEPIAAALGMGIDISKPEGTMIIDIGGGTTEIVVISLSGVVVCQSLKVAGNVFDQDIIDYVKRQKNLMIGERTAEKIKINVGAVLDQLEEPVADIDISGRDLMTGIPKSIKITYRDVALALEKSISKIEEAALKVLNDCPPELSADIHDRGVFLTGGGAYLRGLPKKLSEKLKLKVQVAEHPLLSVMLGTATSLEKIEDFKAVLMK
jgi:rod shape-determining protein MreB